jgi:hypothetical protein
LKERFRNVITKQNPTHLWQKKKSNQNRASSFCTDHWIRLLLFVIWYRAPYCLIRNTDSINYFRNLTVRGILSPAGSILLLTLNTSSSEISQMIKNRSQLLWGQKKPVQRLLGHAPNDSYLGHLGHAVNKVHSRRNFWFHENLLKVDRNLTYLIATSFALFSSLLSMIETHIITIFRSLKIYFIHWYYQRINIKLN